MNKEIWMCGFSTRSFDELESILNEVVYDLLIDLRTRPFSRWASQFNRPHLENRLGKSYLFMGDTLGGLEEVAEEDFLEGIGRVCELASKGKKLVLMCSEKDYKKCHRHMKIEPELRLCGFNVIQL